MRSQSPPEFPAKPTPLCGLMPTNELAFRLFGKEAAIVRLLFVDGLLLLG